MYIIFYKDQVLSVYEQSGKEHCEEFLMSEGGEAEHEPNVLVTNRWSCLPP